MECQIDSQPKGEVQAKGMNSREFSNVDDKALKLNEITKRVGIHQPKKRFKDCAMGFGRWLEKDREPAGESKKLVRRNSREVVSWDQMKQAFKEEGND